MGVFEEIRAATKDLILSFNSIKLLPFSSVNTTFLSHCTSFTLLADQLDNKIKELEEREQSIMHAEHLSNAREQQLDNREHQIFLRESECARLESKVEEVEKKIISKMAQRWEIKLPRRFKPKTFTFIKLKLSTGVFSISKEFLLQFKGSYFEELIFENDSQILQLASM